MFGNRSIRPVCPPSSRRRLAATSRSSVGAGALLAAALLAAPLQAGTTAAAAPAPAGPASGGFGAAPQATNAAAGTLTRTASCVDGGGTTWKGRSIWGREFKDAAGVTRVVNDSTGFTSSSPAATTVDYSVKVYNGSGKLVQTLGQNDRAFDFARGTAYLVRNPANQPSAPYKARVVVNVGDGNDGRGNCTMTFYQPGKVSATQAGDPVVAAAGDIACSPGYTVGSGCQHKAVSDKILADRKVGTVLVLGDLQYDTGSASAFDKSYDPTWGRLKAKTRPVPGNHEYKTPDAKAYYDYFGSRAGDRTKGYYSFDVGSWHFVALNSERDIAADGAQIAWLKADLKANPNRCVAAMLHKPRWSTGAEHGDDPAMAPFVRVLYDAGADLMLSGHDHDYERFVPLNPSGDRDDARGIVAIVSGLGGKNHYGVQGRATTATKDNTSYGYSRLVLHEGSANISYVPAVGSYKDSFKLTCH